MRRSPGAILAVSGVLIFAVVFGLRSVVGAGRAGGIPAAVATVAGIALGIILLIAALTAQGRPSLIAFRDLSERFPDATVARILTSADFRYGLR